MNPFALPGSRPGASLRMDNPPLCPWRYPRHEDFYVDIDNAERAYEEFTAKVTDPQNLLADVGLFVLVTGGEGCGKTSLVHRCANWLRRELAAADGAEPGLICDLTESATLAQRQEQRHRQAGQQLLDDVEGAGVLDQQTRERLERYVAEPANFYRFLSTVSNRVLIILLPRTELPGEVIAYSELAAKKIVFFAESSATPVANAVLPGSAQAMQLRLTVGPLRDEDGRTFALHRMNPDLHDGSGRFRSLKAEAPETMISRRRNRDNATSIRMLQKLLYGLYEEFDKNGEYEGIVNYSDLSDYQLQVRP